MNLDRCPKCGSSSFISTRYALLLEAADWPTLVLFAVILMVLGNLMALASEIVAVGLLIATIPLFFSLLKKIECERCGIEFKVDSREPTIPRSEPDTL